MKDEENSPDKCLFKNKLGLHQVIGELTDVQDFDRDEDDDQGYFHCSQKRKKSKKAIWGELMPKSKSPVRGTTHSKNLGFIPQVYSESESNILGVDNLGFS